MTDHESRDQSDVSADAATTETTTPEIENDADTKSAPEFPHKLRVHALARILGLTSKETIAHLAELGVAVRSPQSSIVRSVAVSVKNRIAELAQEDSATTAPAEAEQPQAQAAQSPVSESPTASLFSGVEVVTPQTSPGPASDAPPLFLQPEKSAASPAKTESATDKKDSATKSEQSSAPNQDGGPEKEVGPEQQDGSEQSGEQEQKSARDGEKSSDDRESGSRRRRRGRRGRGRGRGDDEAQDGNQDSDKTESGKPDTDAAKSDKSDEKPSSSGTSKSKEGADEDADASSDDSTGNDSASNNGTGNSGSNGGDSGEESANSRRRRRRRRRKGGGDSDDSGNDDPPNTVVHEREPRSKRARDEVQGISGSTRLEAKRQRRRDGRDAGRRRPPILTESEFLARRESVDRVMVVREKNRSGSAPEDYTQVAVLEDGVLVEHFVTTSASSSMVGNIYLGRVQNVLPGMEAAFVDIGRGRNGVLYAGEVNWDAAGLDGGSRKIEQALKPGDQVLVQVSKDPVGHKGARLTTQISLAGRYLVYVPGGSSTGISRKLPDVERKRLKSILSAIVPENAGVIIRTASEGVSEEELTRDIERLKAQWNDIEAAVAADTKSGVPQSLYEEPELLIKVVRDLFNEDFTKLVVEGETAASQVRRYVEKVAPDLIDRVEQFAKAHADAPDVFAAHRIDEQLTKALDRKVWLPSGGTLIIERTEAMTVVDVNTGKFTGSGGNLEETVTRNNLEAAEEIVRQMRLRDIGGMIVVDFIDMVLESNRDLVLRRLTEALGRDRTRHQVSEVTSLGLVQMTRKRLGTGLLEAFSTTCTCCQGRGMVVHANPVEVTPSDDNDTPKRSRRRRGKSESGNSGAPASETKSTQNPSEHPMFKAMASHADEESDDQSATDSTAEPDDSDAEQEPTRSRSRRSRSRRSRSASSDHGEGNAVAAQDAVVEADTATQQPPAALPTAEPHTEVAPVAEPTTTERPARPKRRRVARGISTPVASSQPEVTNTPTAPVTTAGPAVVSEQSEPVVAVRKRPRGRAAGRPAGPPQE